MSFMGSRIGTVNGVAFYAHRVRTPLWSHTRVVQPSNHYRFLLQCRHGQFWSPYIRTIEPLIWKGKQVGVRLIADPLKLEKYLVLDGVLVVDLVNQEISRPSNFTLPWEAGIGDVVQFKWKVRWRSS